MKMRFGTQLPQKKKRKKILGIDTMVLFPPTQKNGTNSSSLFCPRSYQEYMGRTKKLSMVHKIMQQEIALGTENVEDFFLLIFVVYLKKGIQKRERLSECEWLEAGSLPSSDKTQLKGRQSVR